MFVVLVALVSVISVILILEIAIWMPGLSRSVLVLIGTVPIAVLASLSASNQSIYDSPFVQKYLTRFFTVSVVSTILIILGGAIILARLVAG